MKHGGSNFSAPSHAQTQRANILRVFEDAQSRWVPSPLSAALAQQYNAGVFELRRSGLVVENKTQTDEATGERRFCFRLIRQSLPAPTRRCDQLQHRVTGLPLFNAAVSE